jgi:hypothetical protein
MRIVVLLAVAACSPMIYTHGVPNLAQVDPNVWRSGQITSTEGWQYVAQLAKGRRVHVLKLNFETEGTDAIARATGFDVEDFAIQPEGDRDVWDDTIDAFRGPDPIVVAQAEAELASATQHVATDFYLVHCTHGQDRTGIVIGLHRVLHEHWTVHRAWNEMIEHHFHLELVGLLAEWLEDTRPNP